MFVNLVYIYTNDRSKLYYRVYENETLQIMLFQFKSIGGINVNGIKEIIGRIMWVNSHANLKYRYLTSKHLHELSRVFWNSHLILEELSSTLEEYGIQSGIDRKGACNRYHQKAF